MSVQLILFLVVAAGFGAWAWQRQKSKGVPHQNQQNAQSSFLPPSQMPEEDPFLSEVKSAKAQADAIVEAAAKEREVNLERQFAEDMKLKKRLSKLATEQELDKALVALWQEVRSYPAWSARPDFAQHNKLNLNGVSGSTDESTEWVEFDYGGQRFKIAERRWTGMEGESYADYSFFEDGDEVFGVGCEIEYDDFGSNTRCINISAFKKRGSWAKLLLRFNTQIQVDKQKSSVNFRYLGAENIKSKFEE